MNQRILDGLRAVRKQVLINAAANTDAQALVVKSLRPEWSALPDGTILTKQAEAVIGTEITMVQHGEKLYKVRQTHPKQAAYEPGKGTEALFAVVDEGHAGTLADPIPGSRRDGVHKREVLFRGGPGIRDGPGRNGGGRKHRPPISPKPAPWAVFFTCGGRRRC